MNDLNLKPWVNTVIVFFVCRCYGSVLASTTGNLPFNSTIQTFQDNFYAWITVASILIWVASCLLLAFGEWGDGMKRLLNILFWLSLALSGATAVPSIFGTGAVF